jgi:hypothetical protein
MHLYIFFGERHMIREQPSDTYVIDFGFEISGREDEIRCLLTRKLSDDFLCFFFPCNWFKDPLKNL